MAAGNIQTWLMTLLGCMTLGATAVCIGEEDPDDTGTPMTLEDFFGEFDPGAITNVDLKAVSELTGVDESALEQWRDTLQEALQGEYVIQAEPLRQWAVAAIPLLDKPYAAWLQSWLDATHSTGEIHIVIPPPSLVLPARPTTQPPRFVPGQLTLAPAIPLTQPSITARPLRAWPVRARPHIAPLKSIFAQTGVPPELVWIAEVESNFNPNARSRAGAVGLFQIMPETAFLLGLRTRSPDDRLDPEKSAYACAEYLKYLHGKFRDWPLALAAYNGGEGRVRRLLTEMKANSFDAIASRLPAETRAYVPKIEATILMHEGVNLRDLKPPW